MRIISEKWLELAPKSRAKHGRDATKKASSGVGQPPFMSTPDDPYRADAKSKTRRPGSIEDTRQAIDLVNGLGNIDVVGGLVKPAEVPAPLRRINLRGLSRGLPVSACPRERIVVVARRCSR